MKKTGKILALTLASLMALSALAGCGSKTVDDQQQGTPAVDNTIHIIGGGSSGGGYHTISTVLAQYFSDNGLGNYSAQPTTGGVQNGLLMQSGELDVAIINGANCMEAYTASSDNFSEPYTNLRAIAVLYSGCFQMAVANDDSIQAMTDLAGRKIGIGGTGSIGVRLK